MKKILFTTLGLILSCYVSAQNLPFVKTIRWQENDRVAFARVALFQFSLLAAPDSNTSLPILTEPEKNIDNIKRCLSIAKKNNCNILIFPELTMSMKDKYVEEADDLFRNYSNIHDAIIIGGTLYDTDRRCHSYVYFPNIRYSSYKIRPSIFESSPFAGQGMTSTDTLVIYKTKYGNFAPIVCVDLISDDINYMIRSLSNHREIEMMFNVDYNPASKEFIRKASSIVTRHPLFIMIVNASDGPGASSERKKDNAYGFSSILGSMQSMQYENCQSALPNIFKTESGNVIDGYENLISVVEPNDESALIFDVNLNVTRVPQNTNAPDQGYPTVKNIHKVKIRK